MIKSRVLIMDFTPQMAVTIFIWCVLYKVIPSWTSDLSRCSLESITPQQQRDMLQCFTQCLLHPCCRAVNITRCEQSYVNTEEMDFVKTVCKIDAGLSVSFNKIIVINAKMYEEHSFKQRMGKDKHFISLRNIALIATKPICQPLNFYCY